MKAAYSQPLLKQNMKAFLSIFMALMLASVSQASLLGWLTSETRDWQFVVATGGIRIGSPIEKDGKRLLPVEYDASGLTTVTCKPTTMNSGVAVRKITVAREGKAIVLKVVTQIAEKTNATGSRHYADLSGIPPGTYEVFYGMAGDSEKRLGQIEIK